VWLFWKRQRADEMRGHHGDGQSAATVAGSGFLGWSMVHRAARPVAGRPVGDPHWPVHVTLANMTRGADGRWLTVAGRWSTVAADERDLMRPAPAVDKLTQALVRNALHRRYGVSFARNACTGLRRGAGPGAAGVRQTRRVDRGAAHRPGVRRRGGGRGARTDLVVLPCAGGTWPTLCGATHKAVKRVVQTQLAGCRAAVPGAAAPQLTTRSRPVAAKASRRDIGETRRPWAVSWRAGG
jgi:hypothetical protein